MTSTLEKATLGGFKALLSHYMFAGDAGTATEKDYTKPLYIPAGLDSLSSIGEPKVDFVYLFCCRA